MKQYQDILKEIMENGVTKDTRNGRTKSVFGLTFRHNMQDGFPLLTTKKMYWKGIVTELLWFLAGDTNIKYLVDNDCHIWDGDAYKKYCMSYKDGHEFYEDEKVKRSFTQEEFINKIKTDDRFAKKWGDLGPIYGKQWRSWKYFAKASGGHNSRDYHGEIDQITKLINDLKNDPDSRRMMVNAWNVGDLDSMTLPPCHYGFQVYTRELSLEERIRIYALKEGQIYEQFVTNWVTKDQWMDDLSDMIIPTRAISLMWNQRSVDTFLGLPFNIASYALLLEIIAKEVNMIPEHLIGSLGDCHIYEEHFESVNEQIERTAFDLPKLIINTEFWQTESGECGVGRLNTNLKGFDICDFQIANYQSHSKLYGELKN